ncbi:hypothetical protein AgCh_023383 [Apium graveolens]
MDSVAVRAPVGKIGANLVRQSAAKTNDLAGNGTTSVVLAQGLIAEGVKVRLLLSRGSCSRANPVLITRGIEKTTKALVTELKLMSKEMPIYPKGCNGRELWRYGKQTLEQG